MAKCNYTTLVDRPHWHIDSSYLILTSSVIFTSSMYQCSAQCATTEHNDDNISLNKTCDDILWFLNYSFQQSSVDEAMATINKRPPRFLPSANGKGKRKSSAIQPMLFKLQDQYFVKVDNTAILIPEVSCFAEAAEFLFMCFFVFSVNYPTELRLFYGFLENILGIEMSIGKSTIVTSLLRRVRSHLPVANEWSGMSRRTMFSYNGLLLNVASFVVPDATSEFSCYLHRLTTSANSFPLVMLFVCCRCIHSIWRLLSFMMSCAFSDLNCSTCDFTGWWYM